ncbi:Transcription repressor [Abeliophyllum distichum]|uniref:Transcription repressor n=1 Tax=Abeliophyllum distichum TaxID=126358 RepID=A0ABD1THH9_9LAMI
MVKSFKLRITRVITTTLQSCRSKHHFTLPKDHVPSFSRISSVNPKFTPANFPVPKDQNQRPSFKTNVSSTLISTDVVGPQSWVQQSLPMKTTPDQNPKNLSGKRRRNDISNDDDLTFAAPRSLLPPSAEEKKKRRGKKKKKNIPSRLSISTSLADSGWFNSEGSVSVGDERDEEETETETLVSSFIRFSTYLSSEFDSRLHSIQETPFTLCQHVCTPMLPLSKDGNSIICDLMKLPFRN